MPKGPRALTRSKVCPDCTGSGPAHELLFTPIYTKTSVRSFPCGGCRLSLALPSSQSSSLCQVISLLLKSQILLCFLDEEALKTFLLISHSPTRLLKPLFYHKTKKIRDFVYWVHRNHCFFNHSLKKIPTKSSSPFKIRREDLKQKKTPNNVCFVN